MEKQVLSISLLTPVWTGNADMIPDGLKMSGVIGSMRHLFEALIRSEGGHTCDITSSDHRCNYEKDKNICPACALFGCTGWARRFKINWDLQPFSKYGTIILPYADRCSLFRNRHADGTVYPGYTSIDTWLATAVSPNRGTIQPNDHAKAQGFLGRMRPAYLMDPTTKQRIPSSMEIVTLRSSREYDVSTLVAGLLSWMSEYYAIGAKVNQGWGFFEILNGFVYEDVFRNELKKLISACSGFRETTWDKNLLNAKNIYPLEPLEINLDSVRSGFEWASGSNPVRYDFLTLGFALQYRLRRLVKFWKFDCDDDMSGYDYNLLEADEEHDCSFLDEWAKTHQAEIRNYNPKHPLEWRAEGAFAEYLFGKSTGNEKEAGKIGVSHPYKKDGKWYVRMISTAEWDYTESLYNILAYDVE